MPATAVETYVFMAALGLNVLRTITGRPIDRVFVRRVLEDVILPLATAATGR